MQPCSNCAGTGIVGVGDRPQLQEGPLSTCGVCNGKGSVAAEATVVEAPVEEVSSAPEVVAVDNENLSDGSSDGSESEPVTL